MLESRHLGRGHGHGDVDVVPVHDLVVVDDGVDRGLPLEAIGGGLHEGRHEAHLDAVALGESVLVVLAQLQQNEQPISAEEGAGNERVNETKICQLALN